jgi:tetratricopeptide (TPR) repeat protein
MPKLKNQKSFYTLVVVLALFTAPISKVCAQASNQPLTQELSLSEKQALQAKEIELKRMLEQNPAQPEVHLNLGNVYWKQGRDGKPIRHYLAAIKLNPNYAEAYYNLANVYFVQGEHEQAVRYYEKAIQCKDEFAPAHNGLGNALIDEKRYGDAIEQYKIALANNSNYPEATYNLCAAYSYAAKYPEAINACTKATTFQRDARAFNNLGNAYFRTRQFEQALTAYKDALEIDPELPEAHFNIAAISLVVNKDKAEAINREKILRVIDPQKSHKLTALINSAK